MQLFYNGVDISTDKSVHLVSCLATDNIGGEADSLKLAFADFNGLWGEWQMARYAQFGDVIEAKKDGWTTGKMYVDEIMDTDTSFILNARSLPPKSRTADSTAWENVRFTKIASDLALLSGLELVTYSITDYEYVRFDRKQESPIKALNRLCLLEGYCLKITNGQAVIYDEKTFENLSSVAIIQPKNYQFISNDIGRKSVALKWVDSNGELIQGTYSDDLINAEIETVTDIPVYNVAQAKRWCKGLLRHYNKNRFTGKTTIEQDLGLAAANVITTPKGDFFITKIQHELIGSKTHLWLRKPIEGDY